MCYNLGIVIDKCFVEASVQFVDADQLARGGDVILVRGAINQFAFIVHLYVVLVLKLGDGCY